MKVVQLFTRERHGTSASSTPLNADHRNAWRQSINYDAALFSAVELAAGITVAIIIAQGIIGLTAGTLYIFIDWMRRFFMPLRDLSAKYSVMQSSMASAERIFELLDTEPAIQRPRGGRSRRWTGAGRDREGAVDPGAGAAPSPSRTSPFAYQGEDWVLRDLSFRVEAGEKVAIVGATGAGKTTIIQLLIAALRGQRTGG